MIEIKIKINHDCDNGGLGFSFESFGSDEVCALEHAVAEVLRACFQEVSIMLKEDSKPATHPDDVGLLGELLIAFCETERITILPYEEILSK